MDIGMPTLLETKNIAGLKESVEWVRANHLNG